jgi:hypothetical protein
LIDPSQRKALKIENALEITSIVRKLSKMGDIATLAPWKALFKTIKNRYYSGPKYSPREDKMIFIQK